MPGSSSIDLNPEVMAAAAESRAWPFEEARKIIERYKGRDWPETVLFETGYGPSGLPHIGTFGEVARTSMVRHAFRVLTEDKVKTRLLCFSDDMDGLRKVPDNVPNQEMLRAHLGKPLTKVPDPFERISELSAPHNNARLRALPRPLRLRLRIRLVDRLLRVRPLRRDAAEDARALRRRSWRSCCRRCARSGADLFAVPADPSRRPASSCRCRSRSATSPRGTIVWTRSRHRQALRDLSHGRPLQGCSGSRTGRCAGRRWVSTTRCRART